MFVEKIQASLWWHKANLLELKNKIMDSLSTIVYINVFLKGGSVAKESKETAWKWKTESRTSWYFQLWDLETDIPGRSRFFP